MNGVRSPSWRIYEDESTYAFLNIFPASEWHTLVVPKVHHVDVFDTPVEELVTVTRAVKRVVDLYQRVLDISNVQIINSSGSQAQQDIFHIHFHIVPRRFGDGQDVQWSTHPGGGAASTTWWRSYATPAQLKPARAARMATSPTCCTAPLTSLRSPACGVCCLGDVSVFRRLRQRGRPPGGS